MTARYYNTKILLPDLSVVDGEVCTDGKRITYAGAQKKEAGRFDASYDLSGCLLMPGFKNCHTHSAMTLLRGYAEDLPLKSWLFDCVFPYEARLTPDDVYWGTRLAILEYLRGGTTSVSDMYFHYDAIAAAMRDTGFKCIAVTSGLDGVRDTEAQLRETEDLLTRYHKPDDNFTLNLGHHAEYTASDALLRGIAALAKKYKAPVHHHLCETRAETDECVARTGLTPPARAEAFGLYEYGGTGYHCVHVSDGDVEIFKRHGVSVVTNPCSNLKLASGIAPLQKYADAGIPFALGTDGAASNNALDMFREAYLASVLQKYSRLRPESTGAHAVLHAAFSVGADIQGIEAHGIAAGQIADFCVLDLESPNLRPFNDITAGIVFSADPGNVRMTVVNGKILYHKGAYFTGETPEKVYAMCEKITARIKSALKKAH